MEYDITVHSPTLQELAVETETTPRIDIECPKLAHLALSFYHRGVSELSVTISARMLERVSWECKFLGPTLGLGHWHLELQRLSRGRGEPWTLHTRNICLSLSLLLLNSE
jgi:hypothetical protein